jgi:hypothetical protein
LSASTDVTPGTPAVYGTYGHKMKKKAQNVAYEKKQKKFIY